MLWGIYLLFGYVDPKRSLNSQENDSLSNQSNPACHCLHPTSCKLTYVLMYYMGLRHYQPHVEEYVR